MEITLRDQTRFPAGTTVKAYPESNWGAGKLPPSGAPVGAPAAEAVTGADGAIAFSGLAADTPYWAYAKVGGEDRYSRFSLRTSTAAASTAAVTAEETRAKEAEALKADKAEIAELDNDPTLAANSPNRTVSQEAIKAYVDRLTVRGPVGVVLPDICSIHTNGVVAATINLMTMMRVTVQRSGTLRDLTTFLGNAAGSGLLGIYDTGDLAKGFYSKLWQAEFAPAANKWQTPMDPNMNVTRGQQLMFAAIFSSITTQVARGASGAISTGSGELPPNYIPAAGGASPKQLGKRAVGAFELPAKLEEGQLVASEATIPQLIIGRLA